MHSNVFWPVSVALTLLLIAVFTIPAWALGSSPKTKDAPASDKNLIPACAEGGYLTVNKLLTSLKIPANCSQQFEFEGRQALVKGHIDPDNIFFHDRFPQLSYQKFTLIEGTTRLEVWVNCKNQKLYDLVYLAGQKNKSLSVDGRIESANLQITGQCRKIVKIIVDSAHQVRLTQ